MIGDGKDGVAIFSASAGVAGVEKTVIESLTPCHLSQVVGLYLGSNPVRLTVLAAESED